MQSAAHLLFVYLCSQADITAGCIGQLPLQSLSVRNTAITTPTRIPEVDTTADTYFDKLYYLYVVLPFISPVSDFAENVSFRCVCVCRVLRVYLQPTRRPQLCLRLIWLSSLHWRGRHRIPSSPPSWGPLRTTTVACVLVCSVRCAVYVVFLFPVVSACFQVVVFSFAFLFH